MEKCLRKIKGVFLSVDCADVIRRIGNKFHITEVDQYFYVKNSYVSSSNKTREKYLCTKYKIFPNEQPLVNGLFNAVQP